VLRPGHQISLLQGARAWFPALIADIDAAQHEVQLETYIFDLNRSAAEVARALMRAAERGVATRLIVDGVGTGELPAPWHDDFVKSGVQWRVYAPVGRLGLFNPASWRRLHRKLCVIDARIAYCGGINVLDDQRDIHLGDLEQPRLDFSVRVTGPLVRQIHQTSDRLWRRLQAAQQARHYAFGAAWDALLAAQEPSVPVLPEKKGIRACLLLRDNLVHRRDIERAYLKAIGEARREIIIANAYFVPGTKLRRALVLAAQRGVGVRLLLHGRYENFLQYHTARTVYGALLQAGIEIHEYVHAYLHAKVAVIDGHWCTVGSSNLDPLSLLLAREANVVLDDTRFASELRLCLTRAMTHEGRRVDASAYALRPWQQRALGWVAYGFMRVMLAFVRKRY